MPAFVLLLALLGGCALLPPGAGPGGATAAAAPAAAASGASAPAASAPASGPGAAPIAARPATGASAVPPGTPLAASAPPGSAPPFATVIKDAKKTEGLFTLWQKDEKVWIELMPGDFDKPFFLSPKFATGIGESSLYGGLLDGASVIEFRRIHNQVQMIAVNTDFFAKAGTPEGRAVAAAFSPSLLASTPVASAAQPVRKSVLVDANALFVNDMLGVGMRLQRSFRQGYSLDGRNSAITATSVKPDAVTLQVLAHFATATIAVPQPGAPPGAPAPSAPFTLPDPRSLFVTARYTLTALPSEPMRMRPEDQRIGYFTIANWDFGDDIARNPVARQIDRWRLEKKDPAAALSEPVKPIVYWLDRTIPLKYRDTITAAILEWNKAFEKIGFKDAIQVRVQPDDADFDTLDGGASVRWMTNAGTSFAGIGLKDVDPRSGEIRSADIALESLAFRGQRAARSEVLSSTPNGLARLMQLGAAAAAGTGADGEAFDPRACLNAEQAAEQLGYALEVLEARGEIDPAGPEAQQFVLDYLRFATMHEVGHTLGLRHNFRASHISSASELADPEFTRSNATSGSVMDYTPANLASPGAPRVAPYQSVLGPYDYWAIEYGYKPIEPAQEKAELERIAARSTEPGLAYGTDEDNYLGIDPDALQFDLGADAIAFGRQRLAIARDLFRRQETRALPADHDYAVLRRSLAYAINDSARAVGVLTRQIGGVRTLRDFPGSGRDPLQPVPAAQQREALDVLSSGLLAADAFVVSPALQRKLAPDFRERSESLRAGRGAVATDFPIGERVLALQGTLLSQLMGDAVATRILDSQGKAANRADAFQLSELYGRLERDVWSELDGVRTGRVVDIPAPRRALQREHLNRIAASLLRPGNVSRVDTRSLVRVQARALLVRISGAARAPGLSADARAHLQDSADSLTQALDAKLERAGV